jgi:hypothetical protein
VFDIWSVGRCRLHKSPGTILRTSQTPETFPTLENHQSGYHPSTTRSASYLHYGAFAPSAHLLHLWDSSLTLKPHPSTFLVRSTGRRKIVRARLHETIRAIKDKVRSTTLWSLHHTSMHWHLFLAANQHGTETEVTWCKLHALICTSPRAGINIIDFLCGQLYNKKLSCWHGHSPTDACPLCPKHLADSCSHITRESSYNSAHIISLRNDACLLGNNAIRNFTKAELYTYQHGYMPTSLRRRCYFLTSIHPLVITHLLFAHTLFDWREIRRRTIRLDRFSPQNHTHSKPT